jgi:flagellar assembly factor FliW
MEIQTTRFGAVDVDPDDVILFPTGMMGLDDCLQWVLLADAQNDALGWLQSTTHGDVALAVVSPRRFVPDYDVRVPGNELAPLTLTSLEDAHVLVVVSKTDQGITLNLRAPLVINLRRRLGRQVVHNVDHAVQHELYDAEPSRKVA